MSTENVFRILDFDPHAGGDFYAQIPIKAPSSIVKFKDDYGWIKADLPAKVSSGSLLLRFSILPIQVVGPGDELRADIIIQSDRETSFFFINVIIRERKKDLVQFRENTYLEYRKHKIFFTSGIMLGEETLCHVAPTGLLPKEVVLNRTNNSIHLMRTWKSKELAKIDENEIAGATSLPLSPQQKLQIGGNVFQVGDAAAKPSISIIPNFLEFNNVNFETTKLEFVVQQTGNKELSCVHLAKWLDVSEPVKIDEKHVKYIASVNGNVSTLELDTIEHSAVVITSGEESISLTASVKISKSPFIQDMFERRDVEKKGDREEREFDPRYYGDGVQFINDFDLITNQGLIIKEDVEFVWISEGVFEFGPNNVPENIDIGFYISRYPITNEQYYSFLEKTNRRLQRPSHWRKEDKNGRKIYNPEKFDHPCVNINLSEIEEFCKWMGGRLPTEKEWERAARYTDGRKFPWGESPSDPKDIRQKYCNIKSNDTTSVKKFPEGQSLDGVMDLIGNVWEWTSTINSVGDHILKGGCYVPGIENYLASNNTVVANTKGNPAFGFRCLIQ